VLKLAWILDEFPENQPWRRREKHHFWTLRLACRLLFANSGWQRAIYEQPVAILINPLVALFRPWKKKGQK
jgi:hypothetical protein